MQNKNHVRESYRIYRPISSVGIVFHNLQNSCVPKPFKGFGCLMAFPQLSEMQRMTKELTHPNWKRHKVFLAAAYPEERLFRFLIEH